MDSLLLIVDIAACATLGRDLFVQQTLVLAARMLTLLWSLHGQTFGWCFRLIDSRHPELQVNSSLLDDAAADRTSLFARCLHPLPPSPGVSTDAAASSVCAVSACKPQRIAADAGSEPEVGRFLPLTLDRFLAFSVQLERAVCEHAHVAAPAPQQQLNEGKPLDAAYCRPLRLQSLDVRSYCHQAKIVCSGLQTPCISLARDLRLRRQSAHDRTSAKVPADFEQ